MIVYTCLTGDHPIIPEQQQFETGIKYIFFHTHDIKNKHGQWQFKKIPIEKNELYTQRKYKILSHELFNEPNAYFDTNTIFKPDLKIKLNECVQETDFATALHNTRKTYLDECCFLLTKGMTPSHIIKTTKYLKKLNYDFSKHVCILAGQIIRSTAEVVKNINNTWWKMWQKFEKRDQIFLPASFYFNSASLKTFPSSWLRNRSDQYYGFWKKSEEYYPIWNKGNTTVLPKLINDISSIIRNDRNI